MSQPKFTNKARELIEQALSKAQLNRNTQLEPEHFLNVLLEDPSSILRKLLSKEECNVWTDRIINKINTFGKSGQLVESQMSYKVSQILKSNDEFLSVDAILKNILNLDSIKSYLSDAEDVLKRLKSFRGDKKMDNINIVKYEVMIGARSVIGTSR